MAYAETMIRVAPESKERPSTVIDLDAVENSAVRAGIAYWRQLRGARRFPARSDISPRDIAAILRNTVLLRVIDGGQDYEFRIVGDAHVIAHGFSMQGQRLSGIERYAPGYGAVLKSLYDPVVATRAPFALRGWIERGERFRKYIYSESAFLPLGPDDDTVDHVLNFSVYVPHDDKGG